MSAINQKEYLKKYLGIGKNPGDKKKKKKKDKLASKKVHIIDDDDVDVDNFKAIEEDLAAANEDAPQIVAVIDERPPSLRVDEHNNKLWIPLGEPTDTATANSGFSFKLGQKIKTEKTSPRRNDDCSPPRRSVKTEARSRVESPSRRRNQRQVADDLSPPRHSVKIKVEEDASPPRRRTVDPPKKYRSDDDLSPVRQRQQDLSPPRKPTKSDLSPPRKKLKNYDQDGDFSPPRRSHNKARNSPARSTLVDLSPPRKKSKHDMDGDFSPPRRSRKGSTPPQRRQIKTEDASPPRRKRKTSDASLSLSPPRRKQTDQDKMTKTLDGKKAGLQNADALVKETKALKQREDDVFKNMSAEVSGVNAKTIVRNRKPVDPVEEQRKEKLEKAVKEKYSRWGKGLKQVDDQNERIQQELYEMSKPLARYADDEDLEKYLKDQEREGDPMLAYLRKKKKKDAIEAGVPLKPEYMGEFMPNRFGIKPGYRWDGVDRSNGYEKKWFTVQNEKKASIEESYKWSTEDM